MMIQNIRATMMTGIVFGASSFDSVTYRRRLHHLVLQPGFLVHKDLEAGRLVELMPDYRSTELGVYAVYPTRKFVTPKVRALVDYLVSAFPDSL